MFIFSAMSHLLISVCVISSCILCAQAVPQVKSLELNINKPLLILPKHEADLRYHIESARGVTLFWIANRGKSEVHFVPIWIMQDGKPWTEPEDRPNKPYPRVHISPHGRLYLIPPEGFKDIILSEVRTGQDTGSFIDIKTGG
jgi:hypothetical protein